MELKINLKTPCVLTPAGGLGRVPAWGRLGGSAQAAMTKLHRPGGINGTQSVLTGLEAAKSKIKVADLGSWESAPPGL